MEAAHRGLLISRLKKHGVYGKGQSGGSLDYLDYLDFAKRCPLDNGSHAGEERFPAGRLDRLPLELLTNILLSLDLPSITAFRQANRRAMNLVDCLHEYRAILKHCPNIIRVIIGVEARHYNLATLFRTLCTSRCETCQRTFGGFLYLITCKRICLECLKKSRGIAVKLHRVQHHQYQSPGALLHLPHIRSLPRPIPSSMQDLSTVLFDLQALRQYLPSDSDFTFTSILNKVGMRRAMPRRPLPFHSNHRIFAHPNNHQVCITAPILDRSGRPADWGFFCRKCSSDKPKYTLDDFIDHLAEEHGKKYKKVPL